MNLSPYLSTLLASLKIYPFTIYCSVFRSFTEISIKLKCIAKGGSFINIIEFDAIITKSDERGAGAFVSFPYDLQETFGTKRQIKVQCEFDGIPYRGSIVNMGNGPCIGMLKSIRERLNKQFDDTVHVKLWRDEEPRVVTIPSDLADRLSSAPLAHNFFEQLSYTNKKEYVQWIESAKKVETRTTRLTRTIEMLIQGKKSPNSK